mgnify:CR=1 FL=1
MIQRKTSGKLIPKLSIRKEEAKGTPPCPSAWPPEASPSPDPDPESSNATDPELLGVVTDEEVDPTLENDENGTPITHTMSGLTGAGVGDEVRVCQHS